MKDDVFYSKDHYPRVVSGRGWYRTFLTRPRLNAILRVIEIYPHNTVLEIGCDEGMLLRMLEARTGAIVYGIDINKDSVRRANHPRIQEGDAQAIPFQDSLFDVCVSSHTIEHLEFPEKCLAEAARVLKEGGKAAFIYPFEFFRGMTLIHDVFVTGHIPYPSLLRRIHRHLLNPQKLKILAHNTPFVHKTSMMFLAPPFIIPHFLTLFEKRSAH